MSRRSKRHQRLPRSATKEPPPKHRPSTTRPPSNGVCVYCNERRAITRDHVFAECLFKRPLPAFMLTVPVCDPCNSGVGDGIDRPMKLDEEYMRNVLTLNEAADSHPVAQHLLERTVIPSLDRSPGMKWSIVKTMQVVQPINDHGLILPGQKVSFSYDLSRVGRVLEKITKGLFFHQMRRPLAKASVLRVFAPLDQRDFDVQAKMMMAAQNIGFNEMGDRTIVFTGARNSPEKDETCWLYTFYGSFKACVYTASAERAASLKV